jgi:Holliday junction resolvase RusA-like endonuclease
VSSPPLLLDKVAAAEPYTWFASAAFRRVLSLRVPDEPVAMARPRSTHMTGRAKPHSFVPTRTQEAVWRIKQLAARAMEGQQPFEGPLSLYVEVILPMPRSISLKKRATAQPEKRPDLDRFLNTALDGLAPVWKDDAQVVQIQAQKRYALEMELTGWQLVVREATT